MSDLDDLDRAQREAYFKGELEAESRLPMFLPQDPLAGAALQESERIQEEVWRAEVEAQNMIDHFEGPPTRGQGEYWDIIEKLNSLGGAASNAAQDWFAEKFDKAYPQADIWGKPEWVRSGMFENFIRDVRRSEGQEVQESWKHMEPSEDVKALKKINAPPPSRKPPRDLDVDLATDNLPEGTDIG